MTRAGWASALGRILPLAAWGVDLLIWNNDNVLEGGGTAPAWLVPAGSALVFAALVVRRRFPVPVLIVQLVWATVTSYYLPEYTSIAGILVALYTVAVALRPIWSGAALVLCAVPFGVQGRANEHPEVAMFAMMLIAAAPWALGHLRRSTDLRVARLAADREAATAEALRAERLRIARELHDIVSNAVSVMVVQAAGAKTVMTVDARRAEGALDVIQEVGRQSIDELGRMLGLLRSASGEDLPAEPGGQPGLDGLAALLDKTRAAGLTVTMHIEGVPGRLDPSVALTAYRLVQEALTNTLKHAGPDASADVRLDWANGRLAVTVEDRAPAGSGPARGLSTGHGLLGLRERVATVGGSLETGPLATGFRVAATLPLAALGGAT